MDDVLMRRHSLLAQCQCHHERSPSSYEHLGPLIVSWLECFEADAKIGKSHKLSSEQDDRWSSNAASYYRSNHKSQTFCWVLSHRVMMLWESWRETGSLNWTGASITQEEDAWASSFYTAHPSFSFQDKITLVLPQSLFQHKSRVSVNGASSASFLSFCRRNVGLQSYSFVEHHSCVWE